MVEKEKTENRENRNRMELFIKGGIGFILL